MLNQADAQIRRERNWQILKKVDASKSSASGDTYLSYKTLPSDFDRALHRIYVGTTPFHQIPFEEYIIWKDSPNRFYIDLLNDRYALTGQQAAAKTITFPYIHKPLSLDTTAVASVATTTPSWWPNDLRYVLAYKMAKLYQGNIEPDEISFRMTKEQEREFEIGMEALRNWDDEIRLSALDSSRGYDADLPTVDQEPGSGLLKLGDL